MKKKLTFSKEDLLSSVCRESFFQFLKTFWEVVVPEKPVWNWHIEFLCNEIQVVAERIFQNKPREYDLIINVPPGTTKSTICSVMFPAWAWTRMPSFRSICGSYAHPLALDLSRKSRDIIKSDLYQACFPDIKLRIDQDTKAYYVNTEGGYRYSVGTGGSVIGMHGHALLIDDPIDPEASMSDVDIVSVNNWMSETLPMRKVDKDVTPLILIMQRLHQNDPTGFRLSRVKNDPVRLICLPAELTELVNPRPCRKYYRRGLLDPIRLNKKTLKAARSQLGEFGYAGQMLQSPVPRGGGMFKIENIRIEEVVPSSFKKVVRFWDKAGTSGGGDYSAGVKMGVVEQQGLRQYWILDVVRGQWRSDTREAKIEMYARLDGPGVIVGMEKEPGTAGDESAQGTISRLAGFRADAVRSTGNKELRADTFSSQVNAGNVYMRRAPWNPEFIEELRYFPKSTYDDQVDAASGAFSMLAKPTIKIGAL